ncbi:hypothetical protein [uncultured Aliiroseovarius sp.]|uniref:hypothetical protein n=1 Tax=uncultured Aliiroseovarius sp. TaxID=1658783 RepID=UPI00259A8100|nr:hypothetical protein [uncultured Aliiroseovarius sp.]
MPPATTTYATCVISSWHPGAGDPTIIGWATTGLTCFAGILAIRCARAPAMAAVDQRFQRWFWVSTGIFLMLLALNKQLDLQTYLLAVGRCFSRLQGWYDVRREVQLLVALVATGLVTGWVAWIMLGLRGALSKMWLALSGLVALGLFVALRLFEMFHVVDGGRLDAPARVFEITGPILLILAVVLIWRPQTQG